MKFPTVVLLVLATLLAVSAGKRETGNYTAIINPLEKPGFGFKPQEYHLDLLNIELGLPGITTENPELQPQRICLVVKCFPRNAKYQICRCIKSRK